MNGVFVAPDYAVAGGIGHALVDMHTALLLAKVLGATYAHVPIRTVPISVHDERIQGVAEHQQEFQWDGLFGLGREFSSRDELMSRGGQAVAVPGHGRWTLFSASDLPRLQELAQPHDDRTAPTILQISNNERLLYWQTVGWERQGLLAEGFSADFRAILRRGFWCSEPTRRLLRPFATDRPRIALHIRNSGLWPDKPVHRKLQRDGAAILAREFSTEIEIYSEGNATDRLEVEALYEGLPYRLSFNEDTMQAFVGLATADILLCARSTFVLYAGLLNPGVKVTWQDYDDTLTEMVERKQDRFELDEEWLTFQGALDADEVSQSLQRQSAQMSSLRQIDPGGCD